MKDRKNGQGNFSYFACHSTDFLSVVRAFTIIRIVKVHYCFFSIKFEPILPRTMPILSSYFVKK